MKTQTHHQSVASTPRHEEPAPFTSTPDWRSSFRLTALELNPELRLGGAARVDQQAPFQSAHWLLQDSSAAKVLLRLAADAGTQASSQTSSGITGNNWTAEMVISALGFANTVKPVGLLAEATFLFRFGAACLKFSSCSNTHRTQAMRASRPNSA